MKTTPSIQPVLAIIAATSVSACALFHPHAQFAKVAPVTQRSTPQMSPADAYYLQAASAIDRREYGLALSILQTAYDKKADDVRVLNALGVVYDKLGRFDLSARYYAQAQVIDPKSTIVANNLAYSRLLQGRLDGTMAFALAGPAPAAPAAKTAAPKRMAAAPLAPTGGVITVSPGVVRLVMNEGPPAQITLPSLSGARMVVIDASGRRAGAEPLRAQLATLGWSAPRRATETRAAQPKTLISYPAADGLAARALAKTLPGSVQLVACNDNCDVIKLVVGADSLGWKVRHTPAPRAKT